LGHPIPTIYRVRSDAVRAAHALLCNAKKRQEKRQERDRSMDVWTQRTIAAAFLIAAIALLLGTATYSYKEIAMLPTTSAIAKKK
jgi:hypothetical protein